MTECLNPRRVDASVRESGTAFAAAVATAVRSLRVERGWVLREFARALDLSETLTCRLELGARPIDMERLFVLSSALVVPPTDLVDRAVREVCPFGWPGHGADG